MKKLIPFILLCACGSDDDSITGKYNCEFIKHGSVPSSCSENKENITTNVLLSDGEKVDNYLFLVFGEIFKFNIGGGGTFFSQTKSLKKPKNYLTIFGKMNEGTIQGNYIEAVEGEMTQGSAKCFNDYSFTCNKE